MYGGSSKLGRGGAAARGGGAKRPHSSFPPPSHRTSGPTGGRLSMGGSSGGPRNRPSGASAAPPSAEETFSLIPGKNPLAFGMIIKVTPDLVDKIRHAESLGKTPQIKFDANAKNSNENIIDVGGNEFRFTWSRELADLCDIYEQRQSGEDGSGLLVESGAVWRKVNMQRVLDESTTNHVKKRSEEADRKQKSRKAIVLEHGTPSTKNQIKALAAAESSPWKKFQQKKEPPTKKQKIEPPQGGPPKPVIKPGLSSATVAKSRRSASPLPSPPEQFGAPASPFGSVKIAKSHLNIEEIMPSQLTNNETASSSEKDFPSKARETPVPKGNFGAKSKDLQSLLITLLTENPQGMSLKALEKAVGDTIPESTKKIEPIVKRIATAQAQGRYILKPGVDESFRKPSSNSGSSPEDLHHHQTPVPEVNEKPTLEDKYNQTPARESSFDAKVPTGGLEEEIRLNKVEDVLNSTELVDILQHSPDLGGNGDRRGSSTSGSDSDSESDSSDSGSHSKSRSRSPAGSGSGSSSDSESDASSNSKEGSDEDVDIMSSDDDKEPKHKPNTSEPNPWGTPDGIAAQNGLDEKQDAQGRDAIDVVEKDLFGEGHEAEMPSIPSPAPHRGSERHLEETKSMSPDHDESRDRQNIIEGLFEDEENTIKDSFKLEKCAAFERVSKSKSRRDSDSNHFDRKPEHAKKLKAENLAQPPESLHSLSPCGNKEVGMQKGYNSASPVKSSSDFNELGQRSNDQSIQDKVHDSTGRSDKHAEILGRGRKYYDKSSQQESLSMPKDKSFRDTSNEDGYGSERKTPSNFKEGSGGGKYSVPSDSHYQKHNDVAGKFKESGQAANSHVGSSPLANGRGSFLQREHSDLELGELREPIPEEPLPKKQFERKSSFKQSENRLNTSENLSLDPGRGKFIGRTTLESGKPSPPDYNHGVCGSLEGLSRKKTPEHVQDVTKSHQQAVQSQGRNVSRADRAEVGSSQINKLSDFSSKSRQNESTAVQGIGSEGYGESHKKAPQYNDIGRGPGSNCPYSKYEKDKPELKGAIKDFSQYNDYVQEYREKYDSYCSLNKILESDRKEFQKFGKDLEFAKDRDMDRYRNVVAKLKESYQQCGERHKRLKKIFAVLHEELKHLKQSIKDFALSHTKD